MLRNITSIRAKTRTGPVGLPESGLTMAVRRSDSGVGIIIRVGRRNSLGGLPSEGFPARPGRKCALLRHGASPFSWRALPSRPGPPGCRGGSRRGRYTCTPHDVYRYMRIVCIESYYRIDTYQYIRYLYCMYRYCVSPDTVRRTQVYPHQQIGGLLYYIIGVLILCYIHFT